MFEPHQRHYSSVLEQDTLASDKFLVNTGNVPKLLKIVNKDVKNQLTTKLLSVGPNLASVKLWPCHAE